MTTTSQHLSNVRAALAECLVSRLYAYDFAQTYGAPPCALFGRALCDAVRLWVWCARYAQGPAMMSRSAQYPRFEYSPTTARGNLVESNPHARHMRMEMYGKLATDYPCPPVDTGGPHNAYFHKKAPDAGHLVRRYQPSNQPEMVVGMDERSAVSSPIAAQRQSSPDGLTVHRDHYRSRPLDSDPPSPSRPSEIIPELRRWNPYLEIGEARDHQDVLDQYGWTWVMFRIARNQQGVFRSLMVGPGESPIFTEREDGHWRFHIDRCSDSVRPLVEAIYRSLG